MNSSDAQMHRIVNSARDGDVSAFAHRSGQGDSDVRTRDACQCV